MRWRDVDDARARGRSRFPIATDNPSESTGTGIKLRSVALQDSMCPREARLFHPRDVARDQEASARSSRGDLRAFYDEDLIRLTPDSARGYEVRCDSPSRRG